MSFTLENVVPWGRSFEEYVSMFKLTSFDLQRKILGCGDGPASFNSIMKKEGKPITSIDPIYQFATNEIEGRISEHIGFIIAIKFGIHWYFKRLVCTKC